MDDFDFTSPQATAKPVAPKPILAKAAPAPFKPAVSKFYDAAVAKKLFQTSGKPEQIATGTTLFVEDEKSGKSGLFGKRIVHRMYLLTEGEVTLSLAGKPLDTIHANEIFGEMAVIGDSPDAPPAPSARSATATAKTDCSGYSLDVDELQTALKHTPEFALMLMSLMFDRLRFVAARLAMRKGVVHNQPSHKAQMLDSGLLKRLQNQLESATTIRYQQDKPIMREGETGTIMYIVLEGKVAITIANNVVETVGVGGTFGEMALVDQSPRTATATAVTESALLAINRNALIALVKAEPVFGITLLKEVADRLRYMNGLLG